jgi:hypothetical protein
LSIGDETKIGAFVEIPGRDGLVELKAQEAMA